MSSRNWNRVTRFSKCPVCGKPDWCLVAKDGKAAICARVSDGCSRDLGEAGYLHKLKNNESEGDERHELPKLERKAEPRKTSDKPPPNFEALNERYRNSIKDREIYALANELGLSPESLKAFHVGKTDKGGWSFPMRDEHARIIGLRIRGDNGRKWAYPGSKNGLFMPEGLGPENRLCIVEGPTDAAALHQLGYPVVGRPSCTGGVWYISEWIRLHPGAQATQAIIVADNDGPGQDGAVKLAEEIARVCISVKVVTPLYRNDVREWVNNGATAGAVETIIQSAYEFNRKRHEYQQRRASGLGTKGKKKKPHKPPSPRSGIKPPPKEVTF